MRDAFAVCACASLAVRVCVRLQAAGAQDVCCVSDTVVCVIRLLYVRVNCCVCARVQAAGAQDVCCVVTRWFGGVLLGPQRFALINNTARMLLESQVRTN
jgi:hypothetical protein